MIDNIISISTGFHLNVVSNTFILITFIIPLAKGKQLTRT